MSNLREQILEIIGFTDVTDAIIRVVLESQNDSVPSETPKPEPLSNVSRYAHPDQLDYELMVGSALRYALGRKTYIVGSTIDYISNHLKDLSNQTLTVMLRDLQPFDDSDWQKLFEAISRESKTRGAESWVPSE